MRWLVITCVLLGHAVSAWAQESTVVLLLGGSAGAQMVTGLMPYDPAQPITYSTTTAKQNAGKIQDAIEAAKTDHKAVVIPADWYAVADDDGDGIDIEVETFDGLQILSTGGITTQVIPNASNPGGRNATVLMHISADGNISDDVVLSLRDGKHAHVGPLTICGARVTSDAQGLALIGTTNMAQTGLLLTSGNAQVDGSNTFIYSAMLCQEAIRV